MFTWTKGDSLKLSQHFSSHEFECPCGCKRQKISKSLIAKLESIRTKLKAPLKITSGYRCATYQKKLRDAGHQTSPKRSQHELGRAVDVAVQHDLMPYLLINCAWHFKSIGDGTRIQSPFVHVDERRSRPRVWVYGEEKGTA